MTELDNGTTIETSDTAPPELRPAKFTVAICGGGIAGLTLAIALQKFSSGDIRIDIYEAAKEFTEIGAGVGVWKRPWKVLENLGLAEELSRLTDFPKDNNMTRLAFQMRKSDQSEGFQYFDMFTPMGNLPFHRADFQRVLASRINPEATTSHFSKRLISYTQTPFTKSSRTDDNYSQPSVALQFKDGTTAFCDILVGADGIHSATRHYLLKEAADEISTNDAQAAKELLSLVDPMWSGSVAYRAVVPSERLREINPSHSALAVAQNYTGKDKHLIVFPISHDSTPLVNIVAFCSWPDKEGTAFAGDAIRACEKEEVRAQYVGWEKEVQQLIECMETPTKWSINALRGLPISVHGRVAIMGDAAHAMTPHQGSGAGQAIEDAYILGGLLAHPKATLSTLPVVLKVYEAMRLPHANDVQRRSRMNGRMYEFRDLPWEREADLNEQFNGNAGMPLPRNGAPYARANGKTVVDVSDSVNESDDLQDPAKLKLIGEAAMENWRWAWSTDIDDDLEKAVGMLEERL